MILTKDGKPDKREGRVKRLEFLIKNYAKYSLAHYPWGLSRTDRKENKKRVDREFELYSDMMELNLFSEHTNFIDTNLNNLIMDARNIIKSRRYRPDDE